MLDIITSPPSRQLKLLLQTKFLKNEAEKATFLVKKKKKSKSPLTNYVHNSLFTVIRSNGQDSILIERFILRNTTEERLCLSFYCQFLSLRATSLYRALKRISFHLSPVMKTGSNVFKNKLLRVRDLHYIDCNVFICCKHQIVSLKCNRNMLMPFQKD